MKINKELSNTLVIANLFATILIIAMHYKSKDMIDSSNYYKWNYLLQEFISNGIARVAVPFFSLISGFFLFDSIQQKGNYFITLKKKTRTLVLPYLVSSCIIFLSFLILNRIFKLDETSHFSIYQIARRIIAQPFSVQFWFLRDLIILTIASYFLFIQKLYIRIPLGLILATLWILDIQPFPIIAGWYLVNIEVLFFFWFGAQLYNHKEFLNSIIHFKRKNKIIIFIAWISLIGIRIALDPDLFVWYVRNYSLGPLILYKLSIMIGIVSLIQISEKFQSSHFLAYLSGFNFFAYLFHFIPLFYLLRLTSKIINVEYVFYINFPIALLIVFSLAHLNFRYLPFFYSVLTGGRNPSKIRERSESQKK